MSKAVGCGSAVVGVLLLGLIAQCLPGSPDSSDTDTDAVKPLTSREVASAEIWTGTVTGRYLESPELGFYIDIDNFAEEPGREPTVEVSLVAPYGTYPNCGDSTGGLPEPNPNAAAQLLRQAVPQGARVVIQRFQKGTRALSMDHSLNLVRLIDGDGIPSREDLALHLATQGVVQMDPDVDLRDRYSSPGTIMPVEERIATAAAAPPASIPSAAAPAWGQIVHAYGAAWINQIGETGVCARADQAAAEAYTARVAELKAESGAAGAAGSSAGVDVDVDVDVNMGRPNLPNVPRALNPCSHTRWC